MASERHASGFVPGKGFSRADWDEVCDNPELTDDELAQGLPLAEAMPSLLEAVRHRRGPPNDSKKATLSLQLDRDVLDAWRASGPGWQARINDTLRKAVGL